MCCKGQYYTEYTENIGKRLAARQKGEVHFTKDKLPVDLVHLSFFQIKRKPVILKGF